MICLAFCIGIRIIVALPASHGSCLKGTDTHCFYNYRGPIGIRFHIIDLFILKVRLSKEEKVRDGEDEEKEEDGTGAELRCGVPSSGLEMESGAGARPGAGMVAGGAEDVGL